MGLTNFFIFRLDSTFCDLILLVVIITLFHCFQAESSNLGLFHTQSALSLNAPGSG